VNITRIVSNIHRRATTGSRSLFEGRLSARNVVALFVILALTLPVLVSVDYSTALADISYTAVRSGDWHDPATWGGDVPAPTDSLTTIPSGVEVTVPKDDVVFHFDGYLDIDGSLSVAGYMIVSRIRVDGSLKVAATGTIETRETLNNAGRVDNAGAITMGVNEEFINSGIFINSGSHLMGYGDASNLPSGLYVNTGAVEIKKADVSLPEVGNWIPGDGFTNEGTFWNLMGDADADVMNYGQLTNDGVYRGMVRARTGSNTINNGFQGALVEVFGGRYHNAGELSANVRIDFSGYLFNAPSGTVNMRSVWAIDGGGIFDNAGAVNLTNRIDVIGQAIVGDRCTASWNITPEAVTVGLDRLDWCDQTPPSVGASAATQ